MENNKLGAVHSFETFGSADGPGVRFIVFLQGCALRCQYCHNADTWEFKKGDQKAEDVLKKAVRYKSYWKNGGGITVSGGEPLWQMPFVTELFQLAKKQNISTCLDTAGQPFRKDPEFLKELDALLEVCDLVLLDIKHADSSAHEKLTGKPNENILEFAAYLDEKNIPVWIRHVTVPGVNDDEESVLKLKEVLSNFKNIEKTEVLPYHTLGAYKWKNKGLEYPLEGIRSADKEDVNRINKILNLK